MQRIGIFRSSEISTDCDQCHGRVDIVRGGVCEECRRILCYRHLHGSWIQRLKTDLGARTRCVQCRAGRRQ